MTGAVHQLTATVVVCAHTEERWDDLLASIASVHAQSHPADELTVVVDHNPALAARLRSHFAPIGSSFRITESTGARGLCGARNTGAQTSSCDVVVYLDDDATAEPEWLERLLTPYADPQVLGVGGAATPRWAGEKRPRWFPAEFDWVVGCSYVGMPESTAPIRNLMGCNMSVRRSVLDRTGGFIDAFGRGSGQRLVSCDETEFCIRAAQTLGGGRFVFEPAARVHHRVPRARTTVRYFARRCYAEGRSKALVSRLVGSGDALASERRYLVRVLPAAVAGGVARSVSQRSWDGFAHAAAVTGGLATTGAGYLSESLRPTLTAPSPVGRGS